MTQTEVQQLREEIKKVNDTLTKYIAEDMEWKVRAEPVVKAFENTSWLLKLTVGVLKFLGLLLPILGFVTLVKKYFIAQ